MGRAKVAVVTGFYLAVIQYMAAHTIEVQHLPGEGLSEISSGGHSLSALFPPGSGSNLCNNSVDFLYLTLFFMSLIPQSIVYEPFTYAIAKQLFPPSAWEVPDFDC